MKTKHYFLGLLFCSIVGWTQNYAIGHVATTFVDASRNNRNIAVEIYYPAGQAGDNVPISEDALFPTLVFGHGFVMGYDAYENIREMLVPHGFVMVFPKTEGGLSPSHLEFGKDLAFCVSQMQALNGDDASLFFGHLSPSSALMGHSMGGGAAFLGMQQNPAITALAVLAPAETNPSAIGAAASINVPALIIAGANDCVTPPPANQLPMYDALSGNCKTYISILGASHCQMAAFNFLCQLGEATCSPGPDISRSEQHQSIENYLVPWLKANLREDCEAGASFNDLLTSDEDIAFERNCEQCESLSVSGAAGTKTRLSPNPFSDIVTISMQGNGFLELFDSSGRKLMSRSIANADRLNLEFLARGIYFYRISANASRQSGKIIRK
ncbi:poly(ethylene terephthalate) hydrolase family protein [Flavobacterium selenitireducens]|uniref:poly(ethylene terephthalate) hydrolase family protein n=1 Tax=Flavobacterium selenitireducens TaxID=2722704 RepID=UPI00168AB3C0|nr:T9SS type A sorting domain-containing protein [Flavobacterium selenitireducens]MBD3581430.1 T9SS type A sorting domain-containing protein [Flavobacterium selenitireducens]